MAVSPEFRLAAACARWPPSDRRTEAIRNAAAPALDWPRFLRLATRHQVIGLVHDGLTRAQPSMPPQIMQDIATQAETLLRKNLEVARESLRLQRQFDEANLPVLFVKGAALAVLAFGNVGLRASQDIDLLVAYDALPAATELLLRAGYYRYDPSPDLSDAQLRLIMPLRKDLLFVHEETRLQIELHWRLFLNPHAMAEASIVASSRVVPLTGAAGLRTLGAEDLFAYLCMHGALHWWKRLKWLADVNALLAAAPGGGVERLLRAAEVRGAGRAAKQALLLCGRLLGACLPQPLVTSLGKTRLERWLEATALTAMAGAAEHELREARFGTTRGSLSTFLLNRSWRYRLAELGVQFTNQADVLALPLPDYLRFLHPVLRLPLWAWRHAAKRDSVPSRRGENPL